MAVSAAFYCKYDSEDLKNFEIQFRLCFKLSVN